jgi:RHS repeat-associated protein
LLRPDVTNRNSSTNTFQYNGLGLRTQKVDSTGTRNYVCDGAGVASTVLSDGSAVYSDGSERRSGASSFRHTDALGSTRGITNSSQSATDGILLDAFGMNVSRTGSTPTPFGFVGSEQYQSDPDSGLMLLGHRYYDPSIGRFITSDPVQDGTNWYAYCANRPTGATDPHGTIVPLIVGGVIALTFALLVGSEEPADPCPPGYRHQLPPTDLRVYLACVAVAAIDGELGGTVNPPGGIGGDDKWKYVVPGPIPPGYIGMPPPDPGQPLPPGHGPDWDWRYPEKPGKGSDSPRWFDPGGGEWRYHDTDPWHPDPHWDYNPWDEWNSKWRNV